MASVLELAVMRHGLMQWAYAAMANALIMMLYLRLLASTATTRVVP